MTYKINTATPDGETTIVTNVTYTFDDGIIFDRDVAHFPISEMTEADIRNRIISEGEKEKVKYNATYGVQATLIADLLK